MWELYLQKVSSKEDVCSQIKKKDGFGGRLVTLDLAKESSRNLKENIS